MEVEEGKRLTAAPGVDLLYIRDPELARYHLPSASSDTYELTASPHGLDAPDASPTFIGKRQRRMDGASSVVLNLSNTSASAPIEAGLAIYKDEHRFLRLYFHSANKVVLQTVNKAKQINRSVEHQLSHTPTALKFIFSYTEHEYLASVVADGGERLELARVDAVELSGKDFVGPIVGVFAVGEGEKARFGEFVVDGAVVERGGA